MHRSPSLPSAAAVPVPDVPRELLTRGPPAGSGRAPEGSGTAEVTRYLTEDHDRNAQRMNDVVVRRIFAAGLDLQTALALIGDHSGASNIYHALDELDQAIRDIRGAISIAAHPVHHACLTKTHDRPPCAPTRRESGTGESPAAAGISHSRGADGVSCSVPGGLDTGDREPGELFRAGVLRRAGPPDGHGHPEVVIAPEIPSSSGSQFSPVLAPRLAAGLFTGQAGCPVDGRLRHRARRDIAGPSSASRCPAAAAATRRGSLNVTADARVAAPAAAVDTRIARSTAAGATGGWRSSMPAPSAGLGHSKA